MTILVASDGEDALKLRAAFQPAIERHEVAVAVNRRFRKDRRVPHLSEHVDRRKTERRRKPVAVVFHRTIVI